MSDLISREFMKSIGGTCIAQRLKNGDLCPIISIDLLPSAEPEPHWIPCSKRLPEEDYWLGGSGKQFSDEVLVSVSNSADEDVYVYVSQTLDGKWNLELPEYYEVIAWMPLPSPYQPEEESE